MLAVWLVSVPGFAYLTDNLVYRPLDYYTFLPPPLGGTYTDALFRTEVKRISDALNTLDGAWNDGRKLTFAMNEYATMSPFNSDHSWLILQHQSYFALYDGLANYVRDLPYQIHASSEPRWSRSSADLLYFLSGNQLRQYQVSSNTVSVVHTFSEYSAISGRGESDICFDGDHLVLAGDGREIFVYQISTDSKGLVLNTAGLGGFDQLYITPNDNVIVGWYQIGYNRHNGVELYDRNMNYLRQLAPAIGHMDVTRDTTGEEILVWVNAADPAPICNNGVVKIRLSDGQQTCLLSLDWSLAIHISAADANWVVVGTYAPRDPDPVLFWPAYTNELLQIKTDGSEVRRLLHHRSRPLNGYNYTPRASLSRDASRLVYSSNYGLQSLLGYPLEYSDAYLVQLSTTLGDTGGTTDEPAPPPPSSSTLTRVEESSTSVNFTGTWFNNVHSLHSGGSARLAMDAGSRATLSFTGSGVRWIAYCDEWSGIARVYLDGVLVSTVDTYRSPAQAQAVIFSLSGLAAGTHTLAIEATGTRSPSSGGAWVWVDAFEVESDTTAPTVSITSPAADSTVAGVVTVSAGASDNVGVAGVQFRLDGANLEAEDTVAPYSVSWDTTRVGDGSHTLTAVARDAAGNSAVSAPVTVFVSNIPAPPPPSQAVRVEENSADVVYAGTWSTNVHSFHSGGSARLAMDTGSQVKFTFTGTAVSWIAYRDEWSGIAQIFLDGQPIARVDTYASPAQAQAEMYKITGLASGTHVLTIEATGERKAPSGGAWIWVDAFEFYP